MSMFNDILDRMREIHAAKSHDYAGGTEFGNFNEAERVGVSGSLGAFIRLQDKYTRCCNLLNGTKARVKEETIEDTLIDLANYAIIVLCLRKQERDEARLDIPYLFDGVDETLRWRQGGMQPSLADLVDWSEAPEWANHAVQQPNGTIIWIGAKRHHDIGIQADRGCWFLRPWVQNEVYKENITLAHDHSKLLPRPSTTDNDEEPEGWKLRPWEIHEDRDIQVTDQEDEAFEMLSVRRNCG